MVTSEGTGFVFPRIEIEEKVVVCFTHDSGIRFSDAQLTSVSGADISGIQQILGKYGGSSIERTFAETAEELDEQTTGLASITGTQVPALSGFHHVSVGEGESADALAAELAENALVSEAYVEPPAVPALFDPPAALSGDSPPLATPDFTNQQRYLNAAPDGVDATYAWTQAGGRGQGINVIDIEGAWNFNHEDLLLNQGGVVGGTPTGNIDWINHGTAVHGEIGGDRNDFGVLGIADAANFSAVSIFGANNSPAKALKTAADKLSSGDIILIELHRPGPNANGQGQFGYIAIEWWAADFAAVQYATAKGIIVIAAAGNGSQNLDDAVYQGRFDRSQRDSGALLVGAGAPPSGNFGPDRSRLGFSNFGALVDAQGWGREVVSTGYGNLQDGTNQNRWYTGSFSGTSSASPIVVGAAASLLGTRKAGGGQPLTYAELRDVFRTTGSPQTDGPSGPASQRIGNRPDLKSALASTQQISSGIATKYWIELASYPPGSARSLWLYVNNAWKSLNNPSADTQDVVERAFLGTDSNVRVWHDNGTIVGLVVDGS